MASPQLSVFAQIKGVGAASGLYFDKRQLHIIADHSDYLYHYDIPSKLLSKTRLIAGRHVSENISKPEKPDFEVLASHNRSLYAIGSGSTKKREMMVEYHLDEKLIRLHSLSALYARIKKSNGVDDADLNIEGAVFTGEHWLLFNRGNGSAHKNGIFKVHGRDLSAGKTIEFRPLMLLNTNNLVASFTDAVLHRQQVYFTAAAEDTKSTFDDGKILGSYLGCIDLKTLNLNYIEKISQNKKIEGITFFSQTSKKTTFLLCEDKDTDTLESTIYKLTV